LAIMESGSLFASKLIRHGGFSGEVRNEDFRTNFCILLRKDGGIQIHVPQNGVVSARAIATRLRKSEIAKQQIASNNYQYGENWTIDSFGFAGQEDVWYCPDFNAMVANGTLKAPLWHDNTKNQFLAPSILKRHEIILAVSQAIENC